MAKKRDNSTGKQKIALRRLMLKQMTAEPVVMETHGGVGQVWASVYAHISQGVVFEKNEEKAAHLARQRPTWAVYEADCIKALSPAPAPTWRSTSWTSIRMASRGRYSMRSSAALARARRCCGWR